MNNENDLISVIIPVYNVEPYLEECLESIINQSYKNLEIILVDDGSPDRCPKICDEYAKKDPRIKVVHQKNGGLSNARNSGIELVTGQYVFFMDSDDIIQLNTIESLLKMIYKDNSEIAICGNEKFVNKYHISNFNIEKTIKNNPIDFFNRILTFKNGTYAWGCLIKTKLLENFEFVVNRYYEDLGSMYNLYNKAKSISITKAKLYKYRKNQNSIVNTINKKKIDDYLKSAKEMIEFIKEIYNPTENLINNYLYGVYLSVFIMTNDEQFFNYARNNYMEKSYIKEIPYKMKLEYIISIYFPTVFKQIVNIKTRRR